MSGWRRRHILCCFRKAMPLSRTHVLCACNAEAKLLLSQGVPLTHKNLASSLANIAATYELGTADRSLLVMPLFHVHGLMAGANVFDEG